MEKIVDRVQTLMATNFRDVKGSKKIKDKVKGLRMSLIIRIMELSNRIKPIVKMKEATDEEVDSAIKVLTETVVEL